MTGGNFAAVKAGIRRQPLHRTDLPLAPTEIQ